MTNYSNRLVQKVQSALTKSISEGSVLYTLVMLSKAIQDSCDDHTIKFPVIYFYRDWIVHTSLDYNKQLKKFFEKWDNIIEGIKNGGDKQNFTGASLNSLEISKLFTEMETLGITIGFEQKGEFVIALVNNLIDAPLRWKGKHIKEFRFTYDVERKKSSSSYICHMQIQHITNLWFNGPELHFLTSQ
ncbi:MAG: hypothetical protein WCW47_01985 [Candidatus Paceibacterota bacterium]|jgi:hypothetical protein